ncbi:hypothetical protein LPJ56_006946, partial [Coemansia sp. RSA 2599]
MSAPNHQHTWSTKEVQRSAVLSQFISSFGDHQHQQQYGGALGQKLLNADDLNQLRLELEQISERAAERAAQLEHSQTQLLKRRPGHLAKAAAAATAASGAQPSKHALSSGATRAIAASLDNTKTPSTDHPANKRVKSNQAPGSRFASGSDSEQSLAGGSQGKYFQTGSTADNSPLTSAAATTAAGASPMGPPPPKMRHSTGTPVQDDFSRVKVSNQVPIQTFWTSLEP